MDIMRAFVGVDRFEVHHVADDLIFLGNPVAAMHVAGLTGDIQSLADIVTLHDRDHIRREPALVDKSPDPQGRLQAQRDVGHHVGELLLEQLRAGKRLAELLAVEAILAGTVPAIFGRTKNTPGDAIAGAVEAAKGALEPGYVWQKRIFADFNAVHDRIAHPNCAQSVSPS